MKTIVKRGSGATSGLPGPVGAEWCIEPGPVVTWTTADGRTVEELAVVYRGGLERVAVRDPGGGNLRFLTTEEFFELLGPSSGLLLDW